MQVYKLHPIFLIFINYFTILHEKKLGYHQSVNCIRTIRTVLSSPLQASWRLNNNQSITFSNYLSNRLFLHALIIFTAEYLTVFFNPKLLSEARILRVLQVSLFYYLQIKIVCQFLTLLARVTNWTYNVYWNCFFSIQIAFWELLIVSFVIVLVLLWMQIKIKCQFLTACICRKPACNTV